MHNKAHASKILLVEDDEISAFVLSSVLGDEGYQIRRATDFAEALTAAEEFCPDLLISDWRLDGIRTGQEVAQELTGRKPLLPVIFISGLERQAILEATQGLNVAAVLSKPCDFDEVVGIVREQLPI